MLDINVVFVVNDSDSFNYQTVIYFLSKKFKKGQTM